MTRNTKFTLFALVPIILASLASFFAPLSSRFYIILGLLIIEAIIVIIFAMRMDKKEIMKRLIWVLIVGALAVALKYLHF